MWATVSFRRYVLIHDFLLIASSFVFLHHFHRRKIFGPKRDEVTGEWIKLHNEELNDMGGPCSIMGERRSVFRVLVGNPRGKEPIWKTQA